MENVETKEVTEQEKEAIVEKISDLIPKGKIKGATARAILRYLLDRHLDNPEEPPTEAQILSHIHKILKKEPDEGRVRQTLFRLRKLVVDFYDGPGAGEPIRMTIGLWKYTLSFQRRGITFDEAIWFWGGAIDQLVTYFARVEPSGYPFGPESPSIFPPIDPFDPLHCYSSIANLFRYYGRLPRVVEPAWQYRRNYLDTMEQYPQTFFPKGHYFLVGNEKCTTPFFDPRATNTVGDHLRSGFMSFLNCKAKMYRDPHSRTVVSMPESSPGHPAIFIDSSDLKMRHVLLTRTTLSPDAVITLLMSQEPSAWVAVTDFLTDHDALGKLIMRPEFEAHWSSNDRAPNNFQIVFATHFDSIPGVTYETSLAVCYRHVTVEACYVE